MDPTSNDHQEFEQVEAIDDLLEDFWFFDNLLGRRSTILRYCHSDPYPFSPSSTHPKTEVLNWRFRFGEEASRSSHSGRFCLTTVYSEGRRWRRA